MAITIVLFVACAPEPAPELHLDGPTEIRVSELGPVDAPMVVTRDGTALVPGFASPEGGPIWTFSRPGVARIEGGRIVAEGPGQVVVTTEWEGSRVEWTLRVELHTVVWFVDPPATLTVGELRRLQIAARAGGVDVEPGTVGWSSSAPQVLAVDPFGIASANEVGTSYLTAQTAIGSAMVEVDVIRR